MADDGYRYLDEEHKSEVDALSHGFKTAESFIDIDELIRLDAKSYHNVILVGTKLDLVKSNPSKR